MNFLDAAHNEMVRERQVQALLSEIALFCSLMCLGLFPNQLSCTSLIETSLLACGTSQTFK